MIPPTTRHLAASSALPLPSIGEGGAFHAVVALHLLDRLSACDVLWRIGPRKLRRDASGSREAIEAARNYC